MLCKGILHRALTSEITPPRPSVALRGHSESGGCEEGAQCRVRTVDYRRGTLLVHDQDKDEENEEGRGGDHANEDRAGFDGRNDGARARALRRDHAAGGVELPGVGAPGAAAVIHAFALLKQACAEANVELKKLDQKRGRLIVEACSEIIDGLDGEPTELGDGAAAVMEHFPIDVFQTGSGTSTNMNANEVIANLACRAAGKHDRAQEPVHPNDHVNMGQSSNDTFPTAMHVAAAVVGHDQLQPVPACKDSPRPSTRKAQEWDDIVKIGRTHLMDATPIRLGQEFSGYAAQAEYGVRRARAGDGAPGGESARSAAPRSARASTPIRASAAMVARHALDRAPASTSRRPPTTSRPRPPTTASWRPPAS